MAYPEFDWSSRCFYDPGRPIWKNRRMRVRPMVVDDAGSLQRNCVVLCISTEFPRVVTTQWLASHMQHYPMAKLIINGGTAKKGILVCSEKTAEIYVVLRTKVPSMSAADDRAYVEAMSREYEDLVVWGLGPLIGSNRPSPVHGAEPMMIRDNRRLDFIWMKAA